MILDTNAVSALFHGDENLVALLSGIPRHHLPTVVVGEYRYGLQRSTRRDLLAERLDGLVRASKILIIDLATTTHYAELRNELRSAGTPIPENDVWIAALARQHSLPIATRDRHFDLVAGVNRESW